MQFGETFCEFGLVLQSFYVNETAGGGGGGEREGEGGVGGGRLSLVVQEGKDSGDVFSGWCCGGIFSLPLPACKDSLPLPVSFVVSHLPPQCPCSVVFYLRSSDVSQGSSQAPSWYNIDYVIGSENNKTIYTYIVHCKPL